MTIKNNIRKLFVLTGILGVITLLPVCHVEAQDSNQTKYSGSVVKT